MTTNVPEHWNGRRVVITGLGAVTSLGNGVETYWKGLLEGRSGVGPMTYFDVSEYPTRIAALVKDFDPLDFMDRKDAKRTARFTQYAWAAAAEALAQAQLDLSKEDPFRVGAEIGSAVGALDVIEQQSHVLRDHGPRRIDAVGGITVLINMAPCQIAIGFGFNGPTNSPVAACATGIVATGEATSRIRRGEADVMLAGATESLLTPLAYAAFSRLGALSRQNDEPERACKPFDVNRDGLVMGEGAAVLVLETLEHALRRDAPILGEVVGYALTEDAYHMAAPAPDGKAAARAMQNALAEARLEPGELGYICAHGTGTLLNDPAETKAIKTALGEEAYRVPISSVKSVVGHMLGAAGAISAVTLVKAIQEGILPPTRNLETPDPECDLDYIRGEPRHAEIEAAAANAFGFGGQDACLVIRRFRQ
ncbi:MAG: beta-ketoacyl-ACP synthase II [Anaerolineae bacterium]|nr:beta-ketoacyl-ACP synthase II [Anaerolineae bacterium]